MDIILLYYSSKKLPDIEINFKKIPRFVVFLRLSVNSNLEKIDHGDYTKIYNSFNQILRQTALTKHYSNLS